MKDLALDRTAGMRNLEQVCHEPAGNSTRLKREIPERECWQLVRLHSLLCYIVRGHRFSVGDTSDGHYSHGGRNFTAGRANNRTSGDETASLDQTSRRVPRFNSARTGPPAADCFRSPGPRVTQPRGNTGGRFGSTPRYSCSSDTAHQSSAAGSSTGDTQSKRCPEQVGTSQSASTAREHGLSR